MQTTKSIYYPPGGLLIWIVIYLELITFGMAILALAYYGSQERELFHQSSMHLNKTIATVNTLLLLTSGFFVAKSIVAFKQKMQTKTIQFLNISLLCGLGFLILKAFEYYEKIDAGFTMDYNSFFTYYWLLTGFHWIHVLVGIVILWFIRRSVIIKKGENSFEDFEAGAAFWHMCDLIWLLLFPVLYLVF